MEDGGKNIQKRFRYVTNALPQGLRGQCDALLSLVLIAPLHYLELQHLLRKLHLFRATHFASLLTGKFRYGCCNRCAEEVMATSELRES
jgi:hypothetical protein